jgi:outer membrane protein
MMRYSYLTKFAAGALLLLSASAVWVWAQGGAAGSAPAAALKIGLLNVRGAIVSTAEGKQASAQMQSQFAPQQGELENLQKQIQDLQTQLATGARTLSDEEKARLQRRGQLLVSQSQRKQDDLNESVNVAQSEIFESIGGKLSGVVDKFGRDNNYSLILDVSAQGSPVIFNAMQLDVTDEIIRLYDQAHPLRAGAPAPAPAAPGQPARPAPAPAPGRGGTTPPAR